jgi:site-specific DNA-methyltransferase (cytosine-N4-specific)
MEFPRRFIAGWCPPDGVVLDPFGGTGTTALVATMLGRTGISVDLSLDYCRDLATWRAADPKERARAAGLDPDEVAAIRPQLPGQGSLLDLLDGDAS